ncbi:MAG: hypothetical protein IID31_11675 [Planctomycetes bacterium]|nr:hypothetical protein [Planctomycetota bacterium]
MPATTSRVAAACLTLAVCAQAGAQQRGEEVLRWRWVEGQVLRYRTTQELSWAVSGHEESANEWTISYKIRREVTAVDDKGVATVEQTYESARIQASDPHEKVTYDSTKPSDEPKKDHRLVKPFAAFVGKTITFTVGPEGKVHSVQGASKILDDALEAAGESNPLVAALTALFRDSLSDESVRRQLEQQLRVVPARAVRRGESWTVSGEQHMPLVGTLVTRIEYTLDKFKRTRGVLLAIIQAEGEITQIRAEADLSFVNPGKSEWEVTGKIEFDVREGRIQRSSFDMTMSYQIGLAGFGEDVPTTSMKQHGEMELIGTR